MNVVAKLEWFIVDVKVAPEIARRPSTCVGCELVSGGCGCQCRGVVDSILRWS